MDVGGCGKRGGCLGGGGIDVKKSIIYSGVKWGRS